MNGVKKFSVDEVVFIKENLLRGVTVADVARYFGVSGETISKIKRGMTYTGVRVEGEERLRPNGVLGAPRNPAERVALPVRGQTEEEFSAKVAESMEQLKTMGVVKDLSAAEIAAQSAFGDIPDTPMD